MGRLWAARHEKVAELRQLSFNKTKTTNEATFGNFLSCKNQPFEWVYFTQMMLGSKCVCYPLQAIGNTFINCISVCFRYQFG